MKHLIVSGCSFTKESPHDTWATYLKEYLSPETYVNTAKSSQGNSLISKGVFYNVCKKLEEGVNPEDIFVAIMWSGSMRTDFFVEDDTPIETSAVENPIKLIPDAKGAWRISSMHWKDDYSRAFYHEYYKQGLKLGRMYTDIGVQIASLENILFIQNFLKLQGIKYLMMPFVRHLVFDNDNSIITDKNVEHYYNQIDFDNWIPAMYEWLSDNYDIEAVVREEEIAMLKKYDCCHPNAIGHKYYFDNQIIPFIEKL